MTLSCDSEKGVASGSYFSHSIYVISVTLPIKILKFRYFSEGGRFSWKFDGQALALWYPVSR
jgi:hypothetical protein